MDGFSALFDAIQNAPRYAALEQTVKKGTKVKDAVMGARGITGDVAESGRIYRPDGRVMRGDFVDQGVTSYVAPGVGKVVDFARETVPFVNPMIQGTRNLIRSFKDDPAGTLGRAWLYVGLPAVTAYSWNEMLGEEYNDYAMSRRSSQDVAMNMYIGVPGKPPEEGIEIPQIHEAFEYKDLQTTTIHEFEVFLYLPLEVFPEHQYTYSSPHLEKIDDSLHSHCILHQAFRSMSML
jgi:hypothetical protein